MRMRAATQHKRMVFPPRENAPADWKLSKNFSCYFLMLWLYFEPMKANTPRMR
jgi:hypothetical protein